MAVDWFSGPADITGIAPRLRHVLILAHGVSAAGGLIVLGSLAHHIRWGWHLQLGRLSGTVSGIVATVLVITGLLLYYLADEGFRNGASLLHQVAGVGACLALLLHVRLERRLRKPGKEKNRSSAQAA